MARDHDVDLQESEAIISHRSYPLTREEVATIGDDLNVVHGKETHNLADLIDRSEQAVFEAEAELRAEVESLIDDLRDGSEETDG